MHHHSGLLAEWQKHRVACAAATLHLAPHTQVIRYTCCRLCFCDMLYLSQELEQGATAIEKGVEQEAVIIEKDLELGLRSFGRGFTVLEQEVEEGLSREQKLLRKELAAELAQAEKVLAKVSGLRGSNGGISRCLSTAAVRFKRCAVLPVGHCALVLVGGLIHAKTVGW